MQEAFLVVVVVVGAIGVLGALVTLLSGRRTWDSYGSDHLLLDSDLPRGRPAAARPLTAAAEAERDDEVRQMLRARNERRARHGQPPLDVEAELARLTRAPSTGASIDEELLAEIRQLVVARNLRRERRGEPPLDVDAEVARQVAQLSG